MTKALNMIAQSAACNASQEETPQFQASPIIQPDSGTNETDQPEDHKLTTQQPPKPQDTANKLSTPQLTDWTMEDPQFPLAGHQENPDQYMSPKI